ncbi:MAG TPA: class I SAM-dependent methyltransferase [Burkholderiales bacterium]|nr:class I SAM-dependent methyltransferase [Burkholderiales bacterium]
MNGSSRASPRIWQADWHVLRGLAAAIQSILADKRLRLRGARVIDFGCGSRPYEGWFTTAGAQYQGADIGEDAEVRVSVDGILDAGDAQYHLVASFQVLEHVWDIATYLREARRVLKREGWLLLSTHGTWLYHPHPNDYRRWTAEGLRREVEAQGFRMVQLCPVVGPLAWTTVLRNVGIAHLLGEIPVVRKSLLPAFTMVLNARAWVEDRMTPARITANNACVYVGLFQRR